MSAISTEEFDRRVDEGEDMEEFLDMEHPIVHKAKKESASDSESARVAAGVLRCRGKAPWDCP